MKQRNFFDHHIHVWGFIPAVLFVILLCGVGFVARANRNQIAQVLGVQFAAFQQPTGNQYIQPYFPDLAPGAAGYVGVGRGDQFQDPSHTTPANTTVYSHLEQQYDPKMNFIGAGVVSSGHVTLPMRNNVNDGHLIFDDVNTTDEYTVEFDFWREAEPASCTSNPSGQHCYGTEGGWDSPIGEGTFAVGFGTTKVNSAGVTYPYETWINANNPSADHGWSLRPSQGSSATNRDHVKLDFRIPAEAFDSSFWGPLDTSQALSFRIWYGAIIGQSWFVGDLNIDNVRFYRKGGDPDNGNFIKNFTPKGNNNVTFECAGSSGSCINWLTTSSITPIADFITASKTPATPSAANPGHLSIFSKSYKDLSVAGNDQYGLLRYNNSGDEPQANPLPGTLDTRRYPTARTVAFDRRITYSFGGYELFLKLAVRSDAGCGYAPQHIAQSYSFVDANDNKVFDPPTRPPADPRYFGNINESTYQQGSVGLGEVECLTCPDQGIETEPPVGATVQSLGTDYVASNGTALGSSQQVTHYTASNSFTIPAGVNVNIQGDVRIYAPTIRIDGSVQGSAAGIPGGAAGRLDTNGTGTHNDDTGPQPVSGTTYCEATGTPGCIGNVAYDASYGGDGRGGGGHANPYDPDGAGGGGHGGRGGGADFNNGGGYHGDINGSSGYSIRMGSGGGGGNCNGTGGENCAGGNGAAAISFYGTDTTISPSAVILVNGGAGGNANGNGGDVREAAGGGGAGGGILISGVATHVSGTLEAKGGAGGSSTNSVSSNDDAGAGGGGGRIKIFFQDGLNSQVDLSRANVAGGPRGSQVAGNVPESGFGGISASKMCLPPVVDDHPVLEAQPRSFTLAINAGAPAQDFPGSPLVVSNTADEINAQTNMTWTVAGGCSGVSWLTCQGATTGTLDAGASSSIRVQYNGNQPALTGAQTIVNTTLRVRGCQTASPNCDAAAENSPIQVPVRLIINVQPPESGDIVGNKACVNVPRTFVLSGASAGATVDWNFDVDSTGSVNPSTATQTVPASGDLTSPAILFTAVGTYHMQATVSNQAGGELTPLHTVSVSECGNDFVSPSEDFRSSARQLLNVPPGIVDRVEQLFGWDEIKGDIQ